MLKNNDVSAMMARVSVALAKGARARPQRRVVYITDATRDELGISALRHPANIQIEFHSGSARRGVGPAIQFGKRAMRRGVRWYAKPIMEQQSRFNQAVLDVDEKLLAEHEKLVTEVSQLRDQADRLESLIDSLQAELAEGNYGSRIAESSDENDLTRGAQRMLKYSAFEDRHRGSEGDIRMLLTPYLQYFKDHRRVLDVGCGRGEFLGLLSEQGISGYGVDSDESMVEACHGRGLEVLLDDAAHHLRSLPSGAVDGIFCSQVAEHLTTEQLVRLIDICYRKLAPGGVLVMETPNPESLSILASFFYVDLTHIKPIHPEALKWAFEAAGFAGLGIERIQPVPTGARLDEIPSQLAAQPGWDVVATNVSRLNKLLYGPQHYAVVGYKPEELS